MRWLKNRGELPQKKTVRAIFRLIVFLGIIMGTINALYPGTTLQDIKRISFGSDKTQAAVRKVEPCKIYGPGDVYYFKGKKGEMSDHWIRATGDMQFQRKYGNWKLITRSGKQYKVGKVPDYLPEDYKIYALSDVHMRIKFSK